MQVRTVADGDAVSVDLALLAACETVHRQLRPQLPADYVATMRGVLAGGAGMAAVTAGGRPIAARAVVITTAVT